VKLRKRLRRRPPSDDNSYINQHTINIHIHTLSANGVGPLHNLSVQTRVPKTQVSRRHRRKEGWLGEGTDCVPVW